MKHVQLFENFVENSTKNLLNEEVTLQGKGGVSSTKLASMPVIKFDKLPQKGNNNSSFLDSLYAAGFPKITNQDPTINDLNFSRYYDVEIDPENTVKKYTKKSKEPSPNYLLSAPIDKAFDKYPCLKTSYERGEVMGNIGTDGIIHSFTVGGSVGNKLYTPDGKVKLVKGAGKNIESTYSCKDGKIIDAFVKNPKGKFYTNNDPWVKETTGGKNSEGKGNHDYIAWYTKDPQGSNWVSKLQQVLIDRRILNILKPTGFLGNQTKNAVLIAANKYNSNEVTNSTNGIRRTFYDQLVNLKKGQ
jgi:hypothetical protein